MRSIIILRPEPGASQTEARAQRLGLDTRRCPLFEARAIAWDAPPPDGFDALLLTSAQTARLAGPQLARYRALPAYAVGRATAQALEAQGFSHVIAGDQDGSAVAAEIAAGGHRRVLHLGGRTVAPLEAGPLSLHHVAVYEMVGGAEVNLSSVLEPGAILLIHSPRAGERIAARIPPERRPLFHLVAISRNALDACGQGWASGEAPDRPDDESMLALAARLCE